MTKESLNFWTLLTAIKRNAFPIGIVTLFTVLFGLAMFQLMREANTFADEIIVQDIERLNTIFNQIDATCSIVEFEHQKNYIDFLNVTKFTSSEVGAMHLMFPDKWAGPYMKENPKVYSKPYLIIRTKKGHFIMPPEGTRLSTGKVVGVDFRLDENADVEQMIRAPKGLRYNDKPMAAKISLGGIRGVLQQDALMLNTDVG